MRGDLNYFYERDLDKKNLQDFYWSLPSHLQKKFEASVRTGVVHLNVLQGYRGPSEMCNNGSGDSGVLNPSHGLQEIKFWWAMRKDIHFIPVLGTVIWGATRAAQSMAGDTDWSSLYFDKKTGECLSHDKNEAADKLNNLGRRLFEEGKYSEAIEYYNNAYGACSSGYCNEKTFKDNASKAEAELKARNLNSDGDCLFRQSRYVEARDKYKEAYDKSQVSELYGMYKVNRDKAQCEVDAKNLNSQADNLFEEGKYSEAECKYQEACDKSQVLMEKNVYGNSRDKSRNILNILVLIESFWEQAWDAENDNDNDRSEQASEFFDTLLDETKDALMNFPGNRKFEQYEALVELKIEGNQVFNQGLESQQSGMALYEAAQKLKLQEKYESANMRFKEAKDCFQTAFEKFETGSRCDQRFFSCVEFVREHIDEVAKSIETIDKYLLSTGLQKLDIDFNENSGDLSSSLEETEKHKDYCAHID